MIPLDMQHYVTVTTAEMVATWRANGCTDTDVIRARCVVAAASMVNTAIRDDWEQESYMREMERGIDRALDQKPED